MGRYPSGQKITGGPVARFVNGLSWALNLPGAVVGLFAGYRRILGAGGLALFSFHGGRSERLYPGLHISVNIGFSEKDAFFKFDTRKPLPAELEEKVMADFQIGLGFAGGQIVFGHTRDILGPLTIPRQAKNKLDNGITRYILIWRG